jgi:hypothetical protein
MKPDSLAHSGAVFCFPAFFRSCHGHVSGRSCVRVKDLLMWGSSAVFKCLRRGDDDGWGPLRVPTAEICEACLEFLANGKKYLKIAGTTQLRGVSYTCLSLPAGRSFIRSCKIRVSKHRLQLDRGFCSRPLPSNDVLILRDKRSDREHTRAAPSIGRTLNLTEIPPLHTTLWCDA